MADQSASAAPRFVGQSIGRKENRRFLTGRGQYVDDHSLPGMLHAHFVRSPLARAKIAKVDVSAAKALPGVRGVFVAADINPAVKSPLPNTFSGDVALDASGIPGPLAAGEVGFVGDPVILIVAEDRYIAEDAAELVEIDYDPLDPVVDIDSAKTAPPCLPHLKSNTTNSMDMALPGANEAFENAAAIVKKTISTARVAPSPMETRAVIAALGAHEQINVWLSSQNPHHARAFISKVLGLAENQVRVVSPDVGGGFGQKYCVHRDEVAVIQAARLLGRPVKWVEDRAEALQAGGHSRMERLGMEFAFDKDGLIKAARFSCEDARGADPLQSVDGTGHIMAMFHTGPYKIPTTAIRLSSYFTNTGGNVAYRGPWGGETFIREAAMDEAARQLKIDPIELRRRNMITKEDQPYKLPLGVEIDGVTPGETLEQALGMLNYEAFRAEQAKARAEGRYIGLGTSVYIEPCAISFTLNASDAAEVRLEYSGKVSAVMTVHSQGHGVETTMAQVIADEMGVDVADVTVIFGDTSAIGYGSGAGGSRQALVGGAAAKVASGMLREKVIKIGAHLLQSSPEELRVENGHVVSGGATPRSVSFAEIGHLAYHAPAMLPAGMESGVEARYRFAPPPLSFSNAAHLCVVEVDVATGMVKVLRWISSEDCGVMLNPAVVEGQIAGGVVQALGMVLWEHQHYDAEGNPSAGTFKDYLMPLSTDIPQIEYGHLCTPSQTPTGAKGVGEGGAIVGPPAIFNAVLDALSPFNVSFDTLPLTPARILSAIEAGKTSGSEQGR